MYSSSILENGIRIITETMPETRSLSVGILVDVSPKNESRDQWGIAHLAEHMMFQGTSTRDARTISRFMDESGGQMGGFTAKDYTCYSTTVLDEYATYAMDLMGDIFLNSEYPEKMLVHEKQAVLREIEGEMDIPCDRAHSLLKSGVWGSHHLGRTVAGVPETVQGLTREDIIHFIHGNYLPDRVIVAAAGNLNHGDFVSQVRDSFWRMTGQSRSVVFPAPVFTPKLIIEKRAVKQAYFSLGVEALPYAHQNRYLLHILNSIIGGGTSSRLYTRLREEQGLVYEIGSEYHAYNDTGLLVIEGSTAPEYLIQVLCTILIALWQLATMDEPISEDELWKVRMQIRAQHLIASESTNTRMSRLATQAFYFGRPISEAEILTQLEGIEQDDLNAFLNTYFIHALKDISLCIVGPEGADTFTREGVERLLADFK